MNEKVKKLAEKAGFVFWDDEDYNPGEFIDWASNYDREFIDYTDILVKDVFEQIKALSEQQAVITHEELKQQILELYKD